MDLSACEKRELRKQYIAARKGLNEAERAEKSRRIAGRIAALPEFADASTVLVYSAVPGEADLRMLPDLPASAGKRFAFPVCLSRTEMAAMVPGGWKTGAFGIREPDPECSQAVDPAEIGLVICPGVAFDLSRTRLGMGGGFYDRFLPQCRNAAVIMAAFEIQRADCLPREPEDIPMDRIVTEDAVYGP